MPNFKTLGQPFLEEQLWPQKKREERKKVNDYSGTIVSERRRWRPPTLGPKVQEILNLYCMPQYGVHMIDMLARPHRGNNYIKLNKFE